MVYFKESYTLLRFQNIYIFKVGGGPNANFYRNLENL